ncbi:PREDICTED: metaxin-1 [Ceratosolen solmsi marchali]|uniref:Metaxin-1 n=1 Tax=Ceratosolen solmsi marchali TaxID=326594 RepID=A0AAJ6YUD7_9HYME|nr:PREDICTED: metaxin-1 [Ceratosolen solmsi marchali]
MSNCYQVDVWKGDWNLPSIDVDCLKVLTFAKFHNISLTVITKNNPFKTPNGYLPVLTFKKNTFSTVDEILNVTHKNCTDCKSSPECPETVAYNIMLEDCLNPALQYLWWIDQQNLNEVIRPWYCEALPFPCNYYYPGKYEKNAKCLIESLYPTEESEDIEALIYTKAKECIKTLSMKLGESQYFFGTKPTKLDALVFSYLAPLLKVPLSNCSLQNCLKKRENLVGFITRILDLYFQNKVENNEKNVNHDKTKKLISDTQYIDKRNQIFTGIFAGIFATGAMVGFALSKGIMQIQTNDYNYSSNYHDYDNIEDYDE